jgi:hypothetical protein
MANHPAITGRRHPKVLEEVFTTIVPRDVLALNHHNILILLCKNAVFFQTERVWLTDGRSM